MPFRCKVTPSRLLYHLTSLCFALTLAITASGCGLLQSIHREEPYRESDQEVISKETAALLSALGLEGQTPNMEALENSSELRNLTSSEGRALALSELWYKHALDVQLSSAAGSFAAYLRSADIALEALLDDGCSSAFNSQCGLLNARYAAATRSVVQALRENAWQSPDLARTRYSLIVKGGNGPLFLADWALHLPTAEPNEDAPRPLTQRAGVGLAAAGCRVFTLSKDEVGVCSPLTFVLSFSPLKNRDRTDAVLSVYDAYQREVVAVKGRDLPLAADFRAATASMPLAHTDDTHSPVPSLNCLSVPTAATTSVIALGSATAVERYRDTVGELLADPAIRSRFSFCFFQSKGRDAVDLLIDLQEVIAPKSLSHGAVSVVLLSLDDNARRMLPRTAKTLRTGSSQLTLSGVLSVIFKGTPPQEVVRLQRALTSRKVNFTAINQDPDDNSPRRTRAALRSALLAIPQPPPPQPLVTPPSENQKDGEDPESELQVSSVL